MYVLRGIPFVGLGNSNKYNFQSNTGHCFIRIIQHILLLSTLFALDHFQIPKHMAIITGLFYLKTTKVSDGKAITVKKELTTLGIPLPSSQLFTKESLI